MLLRGTHTDVAQVLRKQFTTPSTFTPLLPTVHEPSLLSTAGFSRDIVYNKLRNSTAYKSPGPDVFRPRLLRECARDHAYALQCSHGIGPNEWKRGTIYPIRKTEERSDPANYITPKLEYVSEAWSLWIRK